MKKFKKHNGELVGHGLDPDVDRILEEEKDVQKARNYLAYKIANEDYQESVRVSMVEYLEFMDDIIRIR